MKTLLIYASRYGGVKSCAHKINNFIETDMVDSHALSTIDLNDYNRVIIGASVYFGQIDKTLRKWLKVQEANLLNKDLYFFSCSKETKLKTLISSNLFDHASYCSDFGYSLSISSMTKMHRLITKKIAQTTSDCNHLNAESIDLFISYLI